jgi:protein phosphatase
MNMETTYLSHPGQVRQGNEDYIHVDDDLGLYLLADGMGGHNAGEVASELAVKTVHAYLAERIASASTDEIPDILSEAMKAAHEAVNAKAKTDFGLMGMGTTLVEIIVRNDKAFICHAGDSRAYLFRDTLQRLTRDHTMGDQLLENNILPRERIPEKQWHTLTQAVGVGDSPVPDIKQIELVSGDMLLLCSDGLTDMLTDGEIEAIIAGGVCPPPTPASGGQASTPLSNPFPRQRGTTELMHIAQGLVDAANDKGGVDNISVVVVRV